MFDQGPSSTIQVTCAKGLSPFLRQELEALDFPILSEGPAGIETTGSLADCMRLNLRLRVGLRVLYRLKAFQADSEPDFFKAAGAIAWEDFLYEDGYVSVSSAASTDCIRDTRFLNQRCKDAVVDRLRRRTGVRPNTGPKSDEAVVFVYWKDSDCRIYLDTSGIPLSRRGYRQNPWKAPMQETLAAAIIMASGWDGTVPFVNPMCGSGTLAAEAGLIALRRAPGLRRPNFGFMHLRGYEASAWEALCTEAAGEMLDELPAPVIASDRDPGAILAVRQNLAAAGLAYQVKVYGCPFQETPLPDASGVMMLNPEYGERMGDKQELVPVYNAIGDYFKNHCTGWQGYVFSGNLKLAKQVKLRPERQWTLYSGALECRLLHYLLY